MRFVQASGRSGLVHGTSSTVDEMKAHNDRIRPFLEGVGWEDRKREDWRGRRIGNNCKDRRPKPR